MENPSAAPGELRIPVADFFPEAVAPFIGWTVLITVTRPGAGVQTQLVRSAIGVLAGAERWHGYENASTEAAYWPVLHLEHGVDVRINPTYSDAIVSVAAAGLRS